MAWLKHILVAVDFNETSEHALEHGLSLAEDTGARVTVIHVYGLPIYRLADSEYVPTANEAVEAASAAQNGLDELVAKHAGRGVPIATVVHSGPVEAELCAEATRIGADLLVIGTHGRGALGRAILGGVAQKLINTAPVPVLTVRGPKGAT